MGDTYKDNGRDKLKRKKYKEIHRQEDRERDEIEEGLQEYYSSVRPFDVPVIPPRKI